MFVAKLKSSMWSGRNHTWVRVVSLTSSWIMYSINFTALISIQNVFDVLHNKPYGHWKQRGHMKSEAVTAYKPYCIHSWVKVKPMYKMTLLFWSSTWDFCQSWKEMPWKIDIHVDQRNNKTHNKELHAAEFFWPSLLVIVG